MTTPDITQRLFAAKKHTGLSFAELAKLLGHDEVWIAALFYRQARASREEAERLSAALGLEPEVVEELIEFPLKGIGPVVPTDPLIHRFYEIMQVYGMPLKAVIHEKFGDGIMSAIDFSMHVQKEENPKGDRVRIIMSGKFLPYKKWRAARLRSRVAGAAMPHRASSSHFRRQDSYPCGCGKPGPRTSAQA